MTSPDDRPKFTLTYEAGDDRHAIALGPVRLTFDWTGDRWAHSLASGPAEPPLVRSLEGGDDPARVVSPAYQQFHWHVEPDGRGRAMLVGMSGPHHFSAVFALDPTDDGVELTVDLADRCRAEVAVVAATYLVDLTSGALAEADPARIAWALDSGRLAFEAAAESTRVALAEAGRRATQVQALAALDPGSGTHRAIYRWTWTDTGR